MENLEQLGKLHLLRDTWLEVDLGALAANVEVLKASLGPGVALYGVLKANAYGCGLEAMARALIALEVPLLAAATLSEALELRAVHPTWPILIMGPTPHRLMGVALEHDIQVTLVQAEDIEVLIQVAKEGRRVAKAQIKVDTGLRRVGLDLGTGVSGTHKSSGVLKAILNALQAPQLEITGIFSHLALVNWDMDQVQLERFLALRDHLRGLGLAKQVPFHISDSISGIAYPDFRLDAVRLGAALYGMKSYRYPDLPIQPITRLMTRIAQIKAIPPGDGVGYDLEWVATRPSVIGTLPLGYADGYPRELKGKGYVVVKGVRCPVVGLICMDQCMVDLTDLVATNTVSVGDDVLVYGPGTSGEQTVADIATLIDSNKNDILTRVTNRVPRVYLP